MVSLYSERELNEIGNFRAVDSDRLSTQQTGVCSTGLVDDGACSLGADESTAN